MPRKAKPKEKLTPDAKVVLAALGISVRSKNVGTLRTIAEKYVRASKGPDGVVKKIMELEAACKPDSAVKAKLVEKMLEVLHMTSPKDMYHEETNHLTDEDLEREIADILAKQHGNADATS